jgi:hypothetical protein
MVTVAVTGLPNVASIDPSAVIVTEDAAEMPARSSPTAEADRTTPADARLLVVASRSAVLITLISEEATIPASNVPMADAAEVMVASVGAKIPRALALPAAVILAKPDADIPASRVPIDEASNVIVDVTVLPFPSSPTDEAETATVVVLVVVKEPAVTAGAIPPERGDAYPAGAQASRPSPP